MAVLTLTATTPYTIAYEISGLIPQYVDIAKVELYTEFGISPLKTASYRSAEIARTEKIFGYFTGLNPNTTYRVYETIYDVNGHQTSSQTSYATTKPMQYVSPNSVIHSIEIVADDAVYNTFENWALVPAERPSILPPTLKSKYVELPASDGILDYTELLLGKVPFGRRTGSWLFYTDLDKMAALGFTWDSLYYEIVSKIHGKECEITLDDDSDFYYKGRLSVNRWRSSASFSEIQIDYNLDSYCYSHTKSNDVDWQWDTAIEEPEYTILYGDYSVTELKVINFINMGEQPTIPTFNLTENLSVKTDFGDIVSQVIRGEWGVGQDRYDRLTAAGYCWQVVQNQVNEALGSSTRYEVPPDAMTPKTQEALDNGDLDTGTVYELKEGSNYNENLVLNKNNNVMITIGDGAVDACYRETKI